MALTPEKEAKLARLHRRATLYEAVLVHRQDGRKVLLGYAACRRSALVRLAHQNADAVAAFCQAREFQGARFREAGVDVMVTIGDWCLGFSGRTERQAIIEGELPWVGKAGA